MIVGRFGLTADHGRIDDGIAVRQWLNAQRAAQRIDKRALGVVQQRLEDLETHSVDVLQEHGREMPIQVLRRHVGEGDPVGGDLRPELLEGKGHVPAAVCLHGAGLRLPGQALQPPAAGQLVAQLVFRRAALDKDRHGRSQIGAMLRQHLIYSVIDDGLPKGGQENPVAVAQVQRAKDTAHRS